MKITLKGVRKILSDRAEKEWQNLMKAEEGAKLGYAKEEFTTSQRARWAAWDEALEIAFGGRK